MGDQAETKAKFKPGYKPWLVRFAIVFACTIASKSVLATESGNIHWAYSAYFGTGVYQLGDFSRVAVIRPTPRWTFQQSAIEDDGTRTLGWRFRVPVAIGYHNFDYRSISDIIDAENVVTVSVVPGIDLDIPVTRRWLLRPMLYAGWGKVAGSSESAWSYWTGIKSRYSWETGRLEWSLLNSIGYVGFNPNDSKTEGMMPLMMGLEWALPFTNFKMSNNPLELSWHLAYTKFQNDFNIDFQNQTNERVSDKWQIGVALGKHDRNFEFWKFKWDRIGIAYEQGGNQLRGIKVYFSSVFES